MLKQLFSIGYCFERTYDSLKPHLRDKQFIIESLVANLQHHSHNTSLSS